jgi:NlpC/P60 family
VSGRLVTVDVAQVWRDSTGSGRDDRSTEALLGEPLVPTGEQRDGRAQVVAPWQPSSVDVRGYPGWVDVDRLGSEADEPPALQMPVGTFPAGQDDVVDLARTLLGTPYVWGGLSARGIDCSGLVHLVHRSLGSWCRGTRATRPRPSRRCRSTRSGEVTSTSSPAPTSRCTTSPWWSSRV